MGLEVGDQAPYFELKDVARHAACGCRASGCCKNVVLVFDPLAFSGVCTGEAVRDPVTSVPEGDSDDVQLLDRLRGLHVHPRAWSDSEHFEFGLLSDFWPHGEVAKLYGVFDSERGIATRGTFIIDKNGVVRWKVINPIPQARDLAEYSKALAALG